MTMRVAPIPNKHSVRFVEKVHRRLPHAHHRMWSIGLWAEGELRGVALCGAPKARKLAATSTGAWPEPYVLLEVVRVAVIEGTRNGCSMLYGACAKAGRGMGCDDMLTYIDEDQLGTTLKAAGWIREKGLFGGGQATRKSRPRKLRTEEQTSKRQRWWAPWSKYIKDHPDRF